MGAPCRSAQGGAGVCGLRADRAIGAWADRLWHRAAGASDHRVFGGRYCASGGDGRVQFRYFWPPTLRAALPDANAAAYVGTPTGLGIPVAILSIPLWIALAQAVIGV